MPSPILEGALFSEIPGFRPGKLEGTIIPQVTSERSIRGTAKSELKARANDVQFGEYELQSPARQIGSGAELRERNKVWGFRSQKKGECPQATSSTT